MHETFVIPMAVLGAGVVALISLVVLGRIAKILFASMLGGLVAAIIVLFSLQHQEAVYGILYGMKSSCITIVETAKVFFSSFIQGHPG